MTFFKVFEDICDTMPHIILVYPNVARFWIFEITFFEGYQNSPVSKKISQKWTAFGFGNKYLYQSFTEGVSN